MSKEAQDSKSLTMTLARPLEDGTNLVMLVQQDMAMAKSTIPDSLAKPVKSLARKAVAWRLRKAQYDEGIRRTMNLLVTDQGQMGDL